MVTNTNMVMKQEGKGNGYTTIPVLFETKEKLAQIMPKSWDWDKAIVELTEMWKNQRSGKAISTGKPSQDNSTS